MSPPRTTTISPQFSGELCVLVTLALNFGDLFSRHLTEQQPSYIRTRPENFPIRNMSPLSICEAPRPGGTGVFPPALSIPFP